MTLYLLDENVLREMRPGGDAQVAAWLATVSDADLRLSAITFFEKRRGWERMKKKDPAKAEAGLAAIDAIEAAYAGRIVALGPAEMAKWAALLGVKEKNQRDMALAATAHVNGLVIVTRNIKDFVGRDVRVLDPFKAKPEIRRV